MENNKKLINKEVLEEIIKECSLCQHAIKELKLAGYGKGEGGPNDWMYQQVIEAVAVFSSHDNSGASAPYEINLVKKLCSWDIISPLTLKDDEFDQVNISSSRQNKRKSSIFKSPDGSIHDIEAFGKKPILTYRFNTKIWENNNTNIIWSGGLFEHKNDILTGRYFNSCNIKLDEIDKGYIPKPKRIIPCVEIEISPDNWFMAVNADCTQLSLLGVDYDIQWKNCPSIKNIRLEDVTPELEKKAYNDLTSNK